MTIANLIALEGPRTSLILELAGGAPLWRHWGPRIDASDLAPLAAMRAKPSFSPDQDVPLSVFPTFGHGWFGQSALLAHREGRAFEQSFDGCDVEWITPRRAVRLVLTDSIARIAVTLRLAIDEDDALTLSSAIENCGDDVLDVQWLAAGVLPLPPEAAIVRSYGGRHNDEFRLQTDRLGRAGWRRENRRGLTSHADFPGAVMVGEATGYDRGPAWGAQLAWSGNHVQTIECVGDGRRQWQLGEWLAPGEVRLAPGETFCSPEIVAACSNDGLNGIGRIFHAALRRRLDWPGGAMRPRPVTLNSWEGFYFDHDEARARALADDAASLGIERFVLDDGWFRGRDNDRAGLGDWYPDRRKYPDGLGPLIAHVESLGMEFGLWIEPEMVNPDSDLARAHPDWVLQVAGRKPLTARNQLVLDLSRSEVSDYLFERIDALLSAHPIAYLKWDHNRELTGAAGQDGRARYHDQIEAAYALMARIRAAHPLIEIEACAGGGGRTDFGVMRFAHRIWTSDNLDARARIAIQRGFLQFLPPEVMGAHVGAAPAHATGRSQPLDFRGSVALPGHFGIELDPGKLDGADRDKLTGWIARHKALRDVVHRGDTWLGEAADGLLWQAHGSAGDFVLFVYRLDPAAEAHPAPLPLPMAKPDQNYVVEHLDGGTTAIAGSVLHTLGVALPRLRAESCAIVRLTAPAPAIRQDAIG